MRTQQRRERLAGERMVVDDENACRHAFLIGSSPSADKTHMRQAADRDCRRGCGAKSSSPACSAPAWRSLLTYPVLRTQYDRPQLLLVLETAMAFAGLLVAILAAVAFSVDGAAHRPAARSRLPRSGRSRLVAFAIVPVLGRRARSNARTAWAAALAGGIRATALVAAAPFVSGRSRSRDRAIWRHARRRGDRHLAAAWVLLRAHGSALPTLTAPPAAPQPPGPRLRARDPGASLPPRRRRLGTAARADRRRPCTSGSPSASRCSSSRHCISSSPAARDDLRRRGRFPSPARLRADARRAPGGRSALPSSAAPSRRSGRASRARSTTGSRSICSRSRRTPRCSRRGRRSRRWARSSSRRPRSRSRRRASPSSRCRRRAAPPRSTLRCAATSSS